MWVWSELITTLSTLYLPRPRVTTIVEMENGLEIPEAASTVDSIVLRIHECQGVRFGNFTLKSGIHISELLWNTFKGSGASVDVLCGVPYSAVPFATLMSASSKIPMLIKRKEVKTYGTKRLVEGNPKRGARCLIVEDIATTGGSILETAEALRSLGVVVEIAVVLLDRQQGATENLSKHGIRLVSAINVSQVLECLHRYKHITSDTVESISQFVANNQMDMPKICRASFEARAQSCSNNLTLKLLNIIKDKKTNLAFSADVDNSKALLEISDKVGPHICMLKTHVDVLPDFTTEVAHSLSALARKHSFLIMEDRKFADIGKICQKQFNNEHYHLKLGWADLVTVHGLPGPGVLKALREAADEAGTELGYVVVAEMSSAGSLTSEDYALGAMKVSQSFEDCVVGLVCQRKLSSNPHLLHMTPGVHLSSTGDSLGQQYNTPDEVVGTRQSDIIIVGKGIYQASDPIETARKYKEAAYSAYIKTTDTFPVL